MKRTGPGRPKKHKGVTNSTPRRKRLCRKKYDTKPQQKSQHQESGDVPVLATPALPKHWQALGRGKFCKIEEGESGLGEITMSLLLNETGSSSVFVGGKEVPSSNTVLMNLRGSNAIEIIDAIEHATVCPGNPDESFVLACKKRGGSIRGSRGNGDVVAVVDDMAVQGTDGEQYTCTVRRLDCSILVSLKGKKYPSRCKSCQLFRKTLRSIVCRPEGKSEDRTAADSHTRYKDLTSDEKDECMKNLHSSLRVSRQKTTRLDAKVSKIIAKKAMAFEDEDVADISEVIADVDPIVQSSFPIDTPQRIFWEQQLQYNSLRNKKQMRWHPLVVRFALNLKYLSGSAYQAICKSGIIKLPSERTLFDYTHWTKVQTGVQLDFIEKYESLLQEDVSCEHHHTAISLDEMKLKSGLVFKKETGVLVGFTDLGSSCRDIEMVVSATKDGKSATKPTAKDGKSATKPTAKDGKSATKPTEPHLADQVLVFMVRAIFKPSLIMPVAHYYTTKLRGHQIFPLAWDVIAALQLYYIPVVSITSDGAKPNRRFYKLCQQVQKTSAVPYKSYNPFEDKDLFFMCDPPHLLKTARNCFSNSFAHSKSRKMEKMGQNISWKWIEQLYLTETSTPTPGVRLAHKLTRDHVWLTSFTCMRVNLAAQVMSESVACAHEYMDNEATQQTRLFIRMIDKFFDCLNAKGPKKALLERKPDRAPYTKVSDYRFKWLKDEFVKYLVDWANEGASSGLKKKERQKLCLSKETMDGLIITVKSFVELAPQLLSLPNAPYLLSEVFSQDPLERYFSRQRHRGGSNDNPTVCQVGENATTLVQQQSIYRDIKTMNVHLDDMNLDMLSATQPLPKRHRRSLSQ